MIRENGTKAQFAFILRLGLGVRRQRHLNFLLHQQMPPLPPSSSGSENIQTRLARLSGILYYTLRTPSVKCGTVEG